MASLTDPRPPLTSITTWSQKLEEEKRRRKKLQKKKKISEANNDMGHVTHDTQQVGGGELLSKLQLLSFHGLGEKVFLKIFSQRITD